jgi:hypothetical protein
MQCKHAWNREFIDSACTKTFRDKQLKKHREEMLFERQKCLLPQTQEIVARRRQVKAIRDEIAIAQNMIDEIRRGINASIAQIHIIENTPNNSFRTERKQFVRKCPVSECRGFLSTQWKCGTCESRICPDCNEVKQEDHECDPGNVETVRLLKKDTKPCPSCGTMIFKISGCSQMWCPDCHTAFDWNTMQIETGRIHNPHYYEFHQRGGHAARDHGDIPCGGVPTVQDLYNIFKGDRMGVPVHRVGYHVPAHAKVFFDVLRLVNHFEQDELRYRYRFHQEPDYTCARVDYLMNTLSEQDFKLKLQRDEKAREKVRDIGNILTMFNNTASDILRQLVLEVSRHEEFAAILEELRVYTNDVLNVISSRYSCTTPFITPVWDPLQIPKESPLRAKSVAL